MVLLCEHDFMFMQYSVIGINEQHLLPMSAAPLVQYFM